ncbi:MAG: putative membrane protein YecN with MAPEG domain [Alteromonadaceae bacterium]|jgi:uncharacterized membrane protein YecN with MAPEG domain
MSIQLSITGFYTGILTLLFMVLAFNIIRLRYKFKVGVGDGEQPQLIKAIRVHGNFAEHVPITLILLACYELNGGDAMWLHILGASIFIGRILHVVGLTKTTGVSTQRQFGMISIFLVMMILAVENIRLFVIN